METLKPKLATALAQQLLAFYDRQGRDLPWRGSRDLYHIWVSEIMLQQTGVRTVIPYYERFLARFPNLNSLALADEETVLAHWQGLGYYSRARNLLAAARCLFEDQDGCIPEEIFKLEQLPGIGPSTAAAILAIGRDQPHAILDGNVKRVLSRLIALQDSIDTTIGKKKLLALAQQLTPDNRPGDYAQAIMDLGATLCTPRHPNCDHCPWRAHCQAALSGKSAAFPIRRNKTAKPRLNQITLLFNDSQGRLLFGRRPSRGLLGGLWDLPSTKITSEPVTGKPSEITLLAKRLRLESISPQSLGTVRHIFTHFHLSVVIFKGERLVGTTEMDDMDDLRSDLMEPYEKYRWVAIDELETLPISTLHRKILKQIDNSRSG